MLPSRIRSPLWFAVGLTVGFGVHGLLDGLSTSPPAGGGARGLHPAVGQPTDEGDQAVRPAGDERHRRREPSRGRGFEVSHPTATAAPDHAELPETAGAEELLQRPLPQLGKEELLEAVALAVRKPDLGRALTAVSQLRKRFPGTAVPWESLEPDARRENMNRALFLAAFETWGSVEVFEGLDRVAASTGTEGDMYLWRNALGLAQRASRLRDPLPVGLVSRLLSHGQTHVQNAGLLLVWLAPAVNTDLVTRLARSAPAGGTRRAAVAAWQSLGRLPGATVPVTMLERAVWNDPDVLVRIAAIHTMSSLGGAGRMDFPTDMLFRIIESDEPPVLRSAAMNGLVWQGEDVLDEATRGRAARLVTEAAGGAVNGEVRQGAIELLGALGSAGGDTALALLEEPGFLASDYVESTVRVAVEAGHAADLLARGPPPELTLFVFESLRGLDEEEHPGSLHEVAASLGPVLTSEELYRAPDARDRVTGFLEYLAEQSQWNIVQQVAAAHTVPTDIRRRAFSLMLEDETASATGLSLARGVFGDTGSSASLRLELIEYVLSAGNADGGGRAAVVELLQGVVRDDPSFWVRAKARDALDNLE